MFTLLTARQARGSAAEFPYLRTLLHFDTAYMLKVIRMAFEDPTVDALAEVPPEVRAQMPPLPDRQVLVDIMIDAMLRNELQAKAMERAGVARHAPAAAQGAAEYAFDSDPIEARAFSSRQIGALFVFVALCLASRPGQVAIAASVGERMMGCLMSSTDEQTRAEREDALYRLLVRGVLAHIPEDALVSQCERAGFMRLLEVLYAKRKEWGRLLECFLKVPSRRKQALSYVQRVISDIEGLEFSARSRLEARVHACARSPRAC